ncbi:TraI domain-containing protein [uncultured Halomonas sp.]|uniref:TraI domain-containing protein n=1 Tax=uncultured Halomonas sp. TaxID=173971 RepID=UPI00261DB079|nr:TraI domain-containing protein [uncultured Halomonas sp.]
MKLNNSLPRLSANFSGVFRLTGRTVEFDQYGSPYIKLRLSNCDTDYIAGLDADNATMLESIGYLDQVTASGAKCSKNSLGLDVKLHEIHLASRDEVNMQPFLNSIPRTYCPTPESLDKLVASVRSLKSVHLKNFIRRVIERRDRLEGFLNAPASRSHHHAYRGGLLEHSLEVARNVVTMIKLNEPDMPRTLLELGFVAGLLHDIGKTFTYDSKGKPTSAWSLCEHDALTLEACAIALAYLDRHEPELAITLRHIWTCASPGARYGVRPATTLARYVRDADAQSAASNKFSQVFRKSKPGLKKNGIETFWLPKTNSTNCKFETESTVN